MTHTHPIVQVTEHDPHGFRQDITTEGGTLIADEPVELSGTGLGPTPTSLLLAALGACTAMTVRMYARRKQWPLQHISVELQLLKSSLEGRETDKMQPPTILKKILIEGPLDEEQRQRLLAIADRCPVHRLLLEPKLIQTVES